MNRWRLLLALVAVGLLVASWKTGLFALLADPPRLRETLLDMGPWGYVVFVLAFGFLQPVGLPGLAFVMGATYVWPRPIAYALSLTGAMLASAVGFGFARFVAHDWVAARLPARFVRYDSWIARKGWLAVAGLRIVFLVHPLLHAFFGISRIRFRSYMLGCAIGYIPAFAVVTWASGSVVDALKEQPKERLLWIGGAVVALVIARAVLTRLLDRRKKRAEAASEPGTG